MPIAMRSADSAAGECCGEEKVTKEPPSARTERASYSKVLLGNRKQGISHRYCKLEEYDQYDHHHLRCFAKTTEEHDYGEEGQLRYGVGEVDEGR